MSLTSGWHYAGHLFFLYQDPRHTAGGPKNFSYVPNKLSERNEEKLLKSKDRKSIELGKS